MMNQVEDFYDVQLPDPMLTVSKAIIGITSRYQHLRGGADDILDMLHDDSQGYHLVRLYTKYGSSETLQANHIALSDWETLRRVAEIAEEHSIWQEEGWEFSFHLTELTVDFTLPECDAGPYIGTYNSADGNMYDSNADTWASQMGNKAQRLYLFYLPDLKKYGVVYASYWLM